VDAITLTLFVVGIVLLIGGAEMLVRGASWLAAAIGISPLVIGLTVVAIGTSSPELAVSVQSAVSGQPDIAFGNVVGSNVFNVLFILGLTALVAPLVVPGQLVRSDAPVMIGVSFLLPVLALDGRISRLDGALLFAGVVAYTFRSIRQGRKERGQMKEGRVAEVSRRSGWQWIARMALVVLGLVALVLGSRWLVQGAVVIAQKLGVSELVIGLTVVAAGTSLPEVATSVVAALRGERDIAVGNVVGSNIFNLLAILGIASVAAPEGIRVSPAALRFDIPVMIAVTVACLPIFFTGTIISRGEGALFLGYYIAYTLYLVLNAAQHAMLPAFNAVMLVFAIPLTAVTLSVSAVRAVRARKIASG